ncbi:hypothetical protein AGMMS49959_01640 [Planctomycetales bacterium]|nr:hypothetical protein AGMMS49959_01640 [Planctomycetales bacterium]
MTLAIKLTALLCGAAVMALEMVGVRLLEPYLGSTIYVWGAIIGIFLGALSLGYYLGGNLADRSPKFSTLSLLIFAAALWIFAVPSASGFVGEWALATFADPRWQAFFAALILYAAPSVWLGAVSPFLVRLAAREVAKMGQTAGGIYAISTFGSIIGTFLVSFVLTEYVGSMRITWGIGAVLLLVAAGGCGARYWVKGVAVVALLTAGGFIAEQATAAQAVATGFGRSPQAAAWREREQGKNLATRESAYHLVNVFDGKFDFNSRAFTAGGARYMVFNNQLESGCLLDGGEPTATTACGYVQLLFLGALVTGAAPEKVAIIGCGGGVGALMFRDVYPAVSRIDVADIDPVVLALAGKFFGYPYPDRAESVIRSYVSDGRNFLRGAPDKNWDYIVLDAYTAGGRIPKHLISREFFALAARKLTDDGVVVANIISDFGDAGRLLRAVVKTAGAVFRHVYIFPRQLSGASNMLLVGSNHAGDRLSSRELQARFARWGGTLIKQPVGYAVRNSPAQPLDLAAAPLLTDDFCPTDGMSN